MRRVIVLGSTGSIGVQALKVITSSPNLTVAGLACHKNVTLLLEQALSLGVRELAVTDEKAAASVHAPLYPELKLRTGPHAAARLVEEVEADIVLNAIVGFAGLEATLAALASQKALALANKESLVCAGSLVMGLAARGCVSLLPVDSEHSALYQLVAAAGSEAVESVILTASGGPFRGYTRAQLERVTVAEALTHPTWSMGRKITVDSATLMNKGLEVIEAHHLFGLPYERVEVVIHPQSLVHGLVCLKDGAMLAHVGAPDMRVPIAYALHYPERPFLAVERIDLLRGVSLDFLAPDEEVFPAIRLAREAGAKGDAATCALNAANEVAVGAFLEGRLPFLGICEVVEQVVKDSPEGSFGTYKEAVSVDRWARSLAVEVVRAHARDGGC